MDIPDERPRLSFREWKYLDAHLVWAYEGPPRDSGRKHAQTSYFTAWYLLEGHVRVDSNGASVEARKGQWLLLPPGESDRGFTDNSRIVSLHFNARWITGQHLFGFEKPLMLDSNRTKGWLKLCHPMLQLVRRYYPDAYNQLEEAHVDFDRYTRLQTDFQSWLRRVYVVLQDFDINIYLPQTRDSRVLEMIQWIDALSLQNAFRLPELAAQFGLSPTQVNRLFCADLGTTPKRYFERRRLESARAALLSTRQAVKEISYTTGFGHQSEFTTWFKKHTGSSPSEFRAAGASDKIKSLLDHLGGHIH